MPAFQGGWGWYYIGLAAFQGFKILDLDFVLVGLRVFFFVFFFSRKLSIWGYENFNEYFLGWGHHSTELYGGV